MRIIFLNRPKARIKSYHGTVNKRDIGKFLGQKFLGRKVDTIVSTNIRKDTKLAYAFVCPYGWEIDHEVRVYVFPTRKEAEHRLTENVRDI